MFGLYNLLCNSCNWEFVGFAIPGTVPEHVRRRSKRTEDEQINSPVTAHKTISVAETGELGETVSNDLNNQIVGNSVNNSTESEKKILGEAETRADAGTNANNELRQEVKKTK